jgi:hypothetical protein
MQALDHLHESTLYSLVFKCLCCIHLKEQRKRNNISYLNFIWFLAKEEALCQLTPWLPESRSCVMLFGCIDNTERSGIMHVSSSPSTKTPSHRKWHTLADMSAPWPPISGTFLWGHKVYHSMKEKKQELFLSTSFFHAFDDQNFDR